MLRITDLLAKRPDQLSGGQKQRVAIARGIAKQTDVFVLDDPLAGLDFKLRERLVDDLRQLQQETRATFLYTTSDAVEALTLADHLAVLDGGTIVEDGEPERLYRDPERARTMALVGFPPANFLTATLDVREGGPVCRTALFEFSVQLGGPRAEDGVVVGVRPEDLAIGTENGSNANGHSSDWLVLDARVMLREDLGGEEIIYLDCAGTVLTGVDRHHSRSGDLDERTTVAIRPRDLFVFRPGTGERIGRGVAGPSANGG